MQPIVNGLEAKYGHQIAFVFIDREAPENQEIVRKYGIRSQPVFILLDVKGNIVKRLDGPVPEDVLAEAIEAAIRAGN
ncbi:MAG TPA: thioredoxin [Anaerolineae bacterium]|nr:thioredoxin [Anaerolineae bacterium]